MLQFVRSAARGTAGKVLVGVLVVAFTLGGAFSIVNITNNSAPVKVNGEGISDAEIQRMVSMRQQQLVQQLGENATPELLNSGFIRQSVINSLVNQEVQVQATEKLGFAVSGEQVSREIASIPAFQSNGQFDSDTYRRVIAQNGYTPQTFRDERASQLRLNQMQTGLVASAFTLEKEVSRLAELENQEREVFYKSFAAEDFVDQVEVSEADIQSFYDANTSDFLSAEQVKVRYIQLSQSDLVSDMIVTDSELESAYESYVAQQEADANREISHILFADGDDARQEAAAALERLEQGESFADLAAELSDDPASASEGGYLGELVEGFFVEEFYEASLQLTEVGQVSAPVETEFGVHLIKLESLSSAVVASFDEMREELKQQIQKEKARREFALVESQLADQAFQADEIESVAEVFDTTVAVTDWFTRNDQSGIASEPAFVQAAFSPVVVDDGRISDVVRLSDGDMAVVQLEEYQPEQVQSLDEVRAEIEQILTTQRSRQLAEEAAASEREEVARNQAVSGDGWEQPGFIGRDNSELPTDLVEYSFTLPKPDASAPSIGQHQSQNRIYLVAVADVRTADVEADEIESMSDFLAERHGQTEYQSFFSQLRSSADIKIRNGGQAQQNQNL